MRVWIKVETDHSRNISDWFYYDDVRRVESFTTIGVSGVFSAEILHNNGRCPRWDSVECLVIEEVPPNA